MSKNIWNERQNGHSETLHSIAKNFMLRAYVDEYDMLYIHVPIFTKINGEYQGYTLYYFELKRINGMYKVIGLAIGR